MQYRRHISEEQVRKGAEALAVVRKKAHNTKLTEHMKPTTEQLRDARAVLEATAPEATDVCHQGDGVHTPKVTYFTCSQLRTEISMPTDQFNELYEKESEYVRI